MTAQPGTPAPAPAVPTGAPAPASPAPAELPPAVRARGQRISVVANAAAGAVSFIALGPVMTLYANDVLGFDAREIAGILALLPLAVILRLPLIGPIRRLGLARTSMLSDALVLTLLAVTAATPARLTGLPLFMLLVVSTGVVLQLGVGTVQQPLLRAVTSTADRGRFFGRLRLCWMSFNALVMAALPLVVRREMTELQYKVLLGVAMLGSANRIFWTRLMPEPPALPETGDDPDRGRPLERVWRTLRTSPLLRRPLLIAVLLALVGVPIYAVYLRRVLNLPSGAVSVYVAATTAGAALSMLAWGRIADAVGFRPMLAGLLIINMLLAPLQLLLAPFPVGAELAWGGLHLDQMVTLLVLAGVGFAGGALAAGMGIASTSIEHHHVGNRDSLEAMSALAVAVSLVAAAAALFHGYFLEKFAAPRGSTPFFNGVLHFDWVKAWLLLVGLPLQLVALRLLRRLPNTRPYFGVGDFFSTLSSGLVRSSLAQRLVYHEDEQRRSGVARWFGENVNPVNLDPLLELLRDPSYDVKVEAIRSLARSGSPLAGEKLLAVLRDPERHNIADHAAWALGELGYAPAAGALIDCLAPGVATRARAMAARALGKLGDRRAIEPLAAILREKPASQHLVASACRSLLRLGAADRSELVFDAFAALTDREERFELADGLCDTLEVPGRWLLASRHTTLYDSLLEYVDSRPPAWAAERAAAVAALRCKDFGKIIELLGRAAERPPHSDSRRLHSLAAALRRTERWQALTVMATAWLLFRGA